MRQARRSLLAVGSVLLALLAACGADAYPVGPSLPLDKLVEESDLVCKGTVVSTGEVEDPSFDKTPGFRPFETRLKIVAIYRGPGDQKEIAFRHYGRADTEMAFHFAPQHYRFEVGRTYIVFAKKTDRKGVYRQLWQNHRAQEDQGQLLAASDAPRLGSPIQEIFMHELTGLLASDKTEDVKYALAHLDSLSGGDYRDMKDLDRECVLLAVAPLIAHANPEIAQAAIAVLSTHNPYMSQDYAAGWLATVGKGNIPGYGAWDTAKPNLGGKLHWKELAAVVASDAPVDTRALAIRALGRSQVEEVLPLAEKWVNDPEPRIRRAAAVLLADYPDKANTQLLKKLVSDPEPLARQGAAQAIGFGQFTHLIPELGSLVDDRDPQVAGSAALSLLSLPLDQSHDVMKAHLANPQYHALFDNALAHGDPEPYLDDLCDVIRKNKQPENWWGGFVPWGDSWNILYKHVQAQPAAKLQTAQVTRVLDALEYPVSGDPKAPTFYSSSEPRDLYALYLQRGLTDRAKRFRAAAKKGLSYDIDYYFNMVDAQPTQYGDR